MKKFLLVAGLILILGLIFTNFKSQENFKKFSVPLLKENSLTPEITLISTGDIGLVRDINYQIIQKKNPKYPFLEISDYTSDADITISNLEGPLIKNCPVLREGFIFCGEKANVAGLKYAGIDVVNLANNHSTNFGILGLNETIEVLKTNEIVPFGYGDQIEYINLKGKKIALLGFVELGNNWQGLNNATSDNVSRLVSEAKRNSDIVIVAFHWGNEYVNQPSENQITLAHLAIDNGADLILGNHAHWIQKNEIYKNKFITYAQGNTVFDQDWSQETKEGVIYKFIYKNGGFEKIDERFTIIEENIKPRFASEKEAREIKNKTN